MCTLELPKVAETKAASSEWVFTGSINNALKQNHFNDILEVRGRQLGLCPDTKDPGYDPEADLALRLRKLSEELQLGLISWVKGVFGEEEVDVLEILHYDADEVRSRDDFVEQRIAQAKAALRREKKAIAFATVGDAEEKMAGTCALLVRSDCVGELFDRIKVTEVGNVDARPNAWYVLVDVRRGRQAVGESGSIDLRMSVRARSFLNNRLLGKMQGYEPLESLAISLKRPPRDYIRTGSKGKRFRGRGRKTGRGGRQNRPSYCRAASFKLVSENPELRNLVVGVISWKGQRYMKDTAEEAYKWRQMVVKNVDAWLELAPDTHRDKITSLAATTCDPRLRPNAKGDSFSDWPWANAKKRIARDIHEVTLIQSVGTSMAQPLTLQGYNDFTRAECTAEAFEIGVTPFVRKVLMCSKASYSGPQVYYPKLLPHFSKWHEQTISEGRSGTLKWSEPVSDLNREGVSNGWQGCKESAAPFFIDFEQILPENMHMNLQKRIERKPMIAVIGCGRMVEGSWKFCSFIARGHTPQDEHDILQEWLAAMREASSVLVPRVVYFASEMQTLKEAVARIESHCHVRISTEVERCDLHHELDKGQFYVKGLLSLRLKEIVRALEELDLLGGKNGDGRDEVESGVDATALLLSAFEQEGDFRTCAQMKRLIKYNEADCKDLARIWEFVMANRSNEAKKGDRNFAE